MDNKKKHILLAVIVIIGLALRLINLDKVPTILNRDEAALAYNGFLISQTGQDEFAKKWPLTFESFGDYKLPGYPYTLALLFNFLPTNDFVVRLPSAIAGTLLIVISYLLAKNFHITDKKSLLFSLLIALGPVFFFYSRIAFEANLALTFLVAALTIFTVSKPTYVKDILGSVLIFISILFYNTPLMLLPFIMVAIILFRGLKNPSSWLKPVIILFLIMVGMLYQFSALTAQKSGITIFSDENIWHESSSFYGQFSGLGQKIFGNKYTFYLTKIWPRFADSFSLNFLVKVGGSHPWHSLPGHAHVYYTVYGLFWLGLIILVSRIWRQLKTNKKRIHSIWEKGSKEIALVWLLITALAPSVITVDAPHATRSLLFIYLFCFISVFALSLINKKYLGQVVIMVAALVLLESGFYFYNYFNVYPQRQPSSLQTNFDRVIASIEENHSQQQVAIVDSGYGYVLTAWYLKMSPQLFFDTIIKQLPNPIGLKYGQQVSHYHFIADPLDRSNDEEVLLEWTGEEWSVTKYE